MLSSSYLNFRLKGRGGRGVFTWTAHDNICGEKIWNRLQICCNTYYCYFLSKFCIWGWCDQKTLKFKVSNGKWVIIIPILEWRIEGLDCLDIIGVRRSAKANVENLWQLSCLWIFQLLIRFWDKILELAVGLAESFLIKKWVSDTLESTNLKQSL